MTRSLNVFCGSRIVGQLSEEGAVWRFDYSEEWLFDSKGFDLSPALSRSKSSITDEASQRPVQWFFDNLLPEEAARRLVAAEAAVDIADAFGLLTYYGAESAGALTLLPPGQLPEEGSLQLLPDEELSRRIRSLPHIALSADSPSRMSLAGAQHKLAVVLHQGQLWWAHSSRPSSHILKPDHSDNKYYPHSASNEWFCMRLADKLGLPVPAVQIRYVPESVYLIERFDREGEVTALTRLHTIDACQLLNLDRSYKYSQATVANLMAIVGSVRLRAVARERLFRWIVFNLLIGNNDAHLKNLSFFQRRDGVELAPFYDMVCTAVYQPEKDWLNDQLSWPVGTANCLGEISREQVLALGAELGVPFRLGKAVIDSLVDQADSRAAEVIVEFEAIQDVHGWRQGEIRLLRQIRHGVIQDMRRLLK